MATNLKVPAWVNEQQFLELIKAQCEDFKTISNFEVKPAVSGGENYLTIVLRIGVQVELKSGTTQTLSYILKIPLDADCGDKHDFHEMFVSEADMYEQIVPELEEQYKKIDSLNLNFKPRHFRFAAMPVNCDYILLEDLRPQGYTNQERLKGLAQPEMEAVLTKLAQWHAASAQRVAELGDYEIGYKVSYFSQEALKELDHMNATFNLAFLECMQQYNLTPGQKQIITNYTMRLTDLYVEFGRIDAEEFNVLNHGDFWCNNFMFKYAESGAVREVRFVDFQLPKYGTPAQDLFCLLMTTSQWIDKLSKFDDFIMHYYQQLIAHLRLLEYPHALPTLTQLQANLVRNGLWAFVCAQRMLPVVLLPSNADSNVANFMGDDEAGLAFKRRMMLNPSYVKQIELILPWLIERNFIN